MFEVRVEDHSAEVLAALKKAAWENVLRAAVVFQTQVLQALNVSNPRPYKTPSAPGEPPRKRTGFLQANVQLDVDEANLTARVGILANAKYGAYLEFGTRKMKPRPFLSLVLGKFGQQLAALLGG